MKKEHEWNLIRSSILDPAKYGKEQDARSNFPEIQVKGLRIIVTAKAVRGHVRFTCEGKKVSRSLGSCAHDELEKFLLDWVRQVEQYNLRLSITRTAFPSLRVIDLGATRCTLA